MKPLQVILERQREVAFSILERIDVGETPYLQIRWGNWCSLSVSSNGSTWVKRTTWYRLVPPGTTLSVSSNGSTWVKHICDANGNLKVSTFSILERIDVGETMAGWWHVSLWGTFQYPRTDRRG